MKRPLSYLNLSQFFWTMLFALLSGSTTSMAQSWIDLTSEYITNPNYEGNSNAGWTIESNAASRNCDLGAQEFWQGTWHCYQQLGKVPAGKYRLSVQGFYRPAAHSNSACANYKNEVVPCLLYANDNTQSMVSIYSEYLQQNYNWSCWGYSTGGNGGWPGGYNNPTQWYPNNMASGAYCFEQGMYQNSMEFEVDEADEELVIGILNEYGASANWTMFTNWKLEYYGQQVKVTSVKLSSSSVEMNIGEELQLEATINPQNATIKKLTWESSDESVVTVDAQGNLKAVGGGTAVITVKTTDGSNRKATCAVTVIFNGAQQGALIVNELMASNVDMFVDPSWNYGSWMELYNPGDEDVSVGGYWASDDPMFLKKAHIHVTAGVVPAHGYRTLWFDHAETAKDINEKWVNTQIDMKLNCEGGTIYISDDQGNIVVQQDYPQAVMRCSYARRLDGGSEWGYSSKPTPGASNAGMQFAEEQLPEPTLSHPGQVFSDRLLVTVTVPEGAKLRYTVDGSTPTETTGLSIGSNKFTITATTTLRVRCFQDGYLPSNVVTRTYIKNDKDYYLPIVSLVTADENLNDETLGIYVTGSNGKTANQDGTKRNYNMEWDRPASFEYIANGNNRENVDGYFNQEVDICISGGWSRKYKPRSFKVKSSKVYDLKNSLDYPFFADKPYNKNKSLLLRNGGNDEYNQTRLKDAALQQIARVSRFPLNLQSYQPTHVFVNGDYLGMLNMREPSNKHYGYANYGIDTDEIDAFEMSVDSGYVQKDGTKDAFREWYDLSASAADPSTYEQICELVDIDDYVNYMAFKFFLNDWDWPHNNAKGFRDRNDGKFHFVIFDLDNCVDRTSNNIFRDFANKRWHTFYSRPEYGNTSITAEVELVTIFLNMIENEDFRKKFIDTYCIVGGSVFGDEEEIAAIVNEMAANIAPALSWEGHTPYGTGRSFAQGIINAVTGNFRQRMTNVLRDYSAFGLNGETAQRVTLNSNIEEGAILLNGICVPRSKFDGYLFAPVTLKAEAPAGHEFLGWKANVSGMPNKFNVFGKESEWYYYDQGSLDGEEWMMPDYDNSSWSDGPGGFGYNLRNGAKEGTTLDYGPDTNDKRPTYYFRKEFDLKLEPSEQIRYRLTASFDDGYIIYINGEEFSLSRLESGAQYSDYASAYGSDPYDTKVLEIPSSLLKRGKNLIAVELHNQSAKSSDVFWDASLECEVLESAEDMDFYSFDEEIELPDGSDLTFTAYFGEKTSEAELLMAGSVPVKVNEVSAGNSVNVNDYYKKDDWIELYNNTDEDVDIAGMYLSDREKTPLKYQIPSDIEGLNTIIPARGHLVVWASKRDIIGEQIHTNFKLDNDYDKQSLVILTAADETWSDTLRYDKHEGIESYGRYPDGGQNVYHMTLPTIGKQNVLTAYSNLAYTYIYNGIPEPEPEPEPEPDSILKLGDEIMAAEYFTLDGMSMGSNRESLHTGVYLVKYRTKGGKTMMRKEVLRR